MNLPQVVGHRGVPWSVRRGRGGRGPAYRVQPEVGTVGYLCRSGGEVASISPAADQGRVRPGVQRLGSKHSVVMSRRRGICVGSQGVQDRTRPFPASEYRACGIVFPYISANSTAKDLPPTAAKAAVLRTVVFHRCGRMTVRFVRSVRTHQCKRSGRSMAGALRTPSDRSEIRNSRDMRVSLATLMGPLDCHDLGTT